MSLARATALALPVVLTLVACGSEPTEDPSSEFIPVPSRQDPAKTPGAFEGEGAEGLGACAEGAVSVKREPSSIMLLVDRSGSMHIKLPSGESRWQATKKGLSDLVRALPSSAHVGAMMFPQGDAPVNPYCGIDAALNDVKCTAGWPEPAEAARCSTATYKPGVAASSLGPSQISAIDALVAKSDTEFYWGTPLAPALNAAVATQKASTVKGARSVILLTDGNPTSCDGSGISNDISHVVAAAAAGNKDGVKTFVIGVIDTARQAARAENLSPVAVAGGTLRSATCAADNSCFYAVTAASFATDIKKVFEEISAKAFDCKFNVPEPKPGAVADPNTLNIEVTGSGGSYVIKRDPSKKDGWDYLPGGKQLEVYGEACRKLANDDLSVKVVVGCKTQVR
ncbi:MAG: VWA domain-containing protein [Deltaproteobacteria bacterium]|nr:VWA domain-containing protein [Deltaproteobacteria bacterium]